MTREGFGGVARRRVLAGLVLGPALVGWLPGFVLTPAVAEPLETGREGPWDVTKGTLLLMVEDRGCPYCLRFDAEARDSYINSAEGRLAPLVRRRRGDGSIAFLQRVVYSPTFVLLVEGREVGRAVGYQGAELFWMEIARLMREAGLQTAG